MFWYALFFFVSALRNLSHVIAAGSVISVKKGDPHESVNVEWDVDGSCFCAQSSVCFLISTRHCRCHKPLGAAAGESTNLQICQRAEKYAAATLFVTRFFVALGHFRRIVFPSPQVLLQCYLASLPTARLSLLPPTRQMAQELLMYKCVCDL